MWIIDGRPEIAGIWGVNPKISLLGGVIGAFITFTVIKSMSSLGVAKAEITIVVTQIAVAYIIELFIWKQKIGFFMDEVIRNCCCNSRRSDI